MFQAITEIPATRNEAPTAIACVVSAGTASVSANISCAPPSTRDRPMPDTSGAASSEPIRLPTPNITNSRPKPGSLSPIGPGATA